MRAGCGRGADGLVVSFWSLATRAKRRMGADWAPRPVLGAGTLFCDGDQARARGFLIKMRSVKR